MKVFYDAPKPEVRIVKPDRTREEYEFWVLKPVRIGGARKEGVQQIRDDNGKMFINLYEARDEALSAQGFGELAEPISPGVKLHGLDLVEQGRWAAFCKLRGIDPRDIQAMQKDYTVSVNEITAMGKR
jgi:hypothetical protein